MKIIDRKEILNAEVILRQKNGWRIISRDETICQLERKEKPSGCLIVILLLIMILPGVLYAIFGGSTQTLTITVDEEGNIQNRIR